MPSKLVWDFLPAPPKEAVEALTRSLFKEVLPWHRTIASLLLQRGITSFEEARAFFNPSLADLHDPFLMKDMDKAVERILLAISSEQPILIYGDYDVDGTCSVAVLYLFLSAIYPNVFTYVPDRYKEGYGVSSQGIDFADDNQIPLIITLDCGIQSHERVASLTIIPLRRPYPKRLPCLTRSEQIAPIPIRNFVAVVLALSLYKPSARP